ncbi:MAG: hypothetical protein MUP70_03345 [Candidatus Aminicenantes bacterium]|nr:hypothetical protein [Candidatus Aminicenantes bacterium]
MPSVAVENEGMRFQVLLVIDVSDFSCPSCLQSIVDFIHVIPPSIREKRTVAVWRVSDPEEKDEADLKNRIWNKKMRGFVSANFIDFPIWMISESGSEAIFGKGSRLLIFPPHDNTVLSYPFPLAFEERKDVQNLFAEWIQSGIH